jgi:hypothetical protein
MRKRQKREEKEGEGEIEGERACLQVRGTGLRGVHASASGLPLLPSLLPPS